MGWVFRPVLQRNSICEVRMFFFFMLCLKPEAFAEIIKEALLVCLFGANKLKVAFSVFIYDAVHSFLVYI